MLEDDNEYSDDVGEGANELEDGEDDKEIGETDLFKLRDLIEFLIGFDNDLLNGPSSLGGGQGKNDKLFC